MSCGATTFCANRGPYRWTGSGALFVATILVCALPALGQQTSRRAQPQHDGNTNAKVDDVLSTVRYRTPTIKLRQNQVPPKSDLIPTSDSSRRRVANVSGDSTADLFELKSRSNELKAKKEQLRPTLSPEQRFDVVARPTAVSLRRNPMGSRGVAPLASTGTDLGLSEVKRTPAVSETANVSSDTADAGSVAPGNPPSVEPPPVQSGMDSQGPGPQLRLVAIPPIVQPENLQTKKMRHQVPLPKYRQPQDVRPQNDQSSIASQQNTLPANGPPLQRPHSIAESLKGLKFSNVKQFLAKKPNFKDPKQYLAQPAKPARRTTRATTVSRRRPPSQERAVLPRQQAREIVTDERRDGSQLLPTQRRDESGAFSDFADVRDPIPAVPLADITQIDPSHLLVKDNRLDANAIYGGDQFNYSQLTGSPNVPSGKAWLAPNFYHRPLYFDETNLERYGNRLPLQVFVSAAHFFATIPLLPYKMGAQPPYQCTYTYGHCRPGDCVPYQIQHRPLDRKGAFLQALVTTAIVLP